MNRFRRKQLQVYKAWLPKTQFHAFLLVETHPDSAPAPTLIIQHVIWKHVVHFPADEVVFFTHYDETQDSGASLKSSFNHRL